MKLKSFYKALAQCSTLQNGEFFFANIACNRGLISEIKKLLLLGQIISIFATLKTPQSEGFPDVQLHSGQQVRAPAK